VTWFQHFAALPAGKWVLVDVRRPDQYEEGHAQGSVSVPMYSRIDMSKADFAKVGFVWRR
jgi:rhodanese-related sulfurtransferase